VLGRVVKTTYILRYAHDAALRDRVQLQLNRGESRLANRFGSEANFLVVIERLFPGSVDSVAKTLRRCDKAPGGELEVIANFGKNRPRGTTWREAEPRNSPR
jgi:hypothetical protein